MGAKVWDDWFDAYQEELTRGLKAVEAGKAGKSTHAMCEAAECDVESTPDTRCIHDPPSAQDFDRVKFAVSRVRHILTPRQLLIFHARFVVDPPFTQTETAAAINVSQSTVSVEESAILSAVRSSMR